MKNRVLPKWAWPVLQVLFVMAVLSQAVILDVMRTENAIAERDKRRSEHYSSCLKDLSFDVCRALWRAIER